MKNTITINGRLYDATTGLAIQAVSTPITETPVQISTPSPTATSTPSVLATATPKSFDIAPPNAKAVHRQLQKSHTLVRSGVKKPIVVNNTAPRSVTVVERSPQISKFGPENTSEIHRLSSVAPSQPVAPKKEALRPPMPHPVVTKVLERRNQNKQQPQPNPAVTHEQRDSVVKKALVKEHEQHTQAPRAHKVAHRRRIGTALTGVLAALALGGYITYLNMPSISLRIAAVHAGIAAALPAYSPEGYKLTGPIAYQPGQVSFAYTDGNQGYNITQQASTWDQEAVLDNYVSKQSQNYLTYQDHGLTVYTFNNQAAWVNGGILYTISANPNTHMNSDQLLNIVSSL